MAGVKGKSGRRAHVRLPNGHKLAKCPACQTEYDVMPDTKDAGTVCSRCLKEQGFLVGMPLVRVEAR